MKHVLEADSIQLSFGERKILSDVYLKCETGKITGLLGRNGQGKSCIMKIIHGSLPAEKSVRFDRVAQFEAYKRPDLLLYLPQFHFIPKHLKVKRVFNDFDLDFSVFATRFPELAFSGGKQVGTLSGGSRRLVELYTIVCAPSQFAMLDEPFTHLSPLQIEKVKDLLMEAKQQKGLLITDHMYQHIIDVTDDLYILSNGKAHLAKSLEDIETLGYAKM
jgi:ABC-type lipopolysaccharide export system ATPase subunit